MSTSILQVIESGGYDLDTYEGAEWLLAQQNQFEELIEKAEEVRDAHIEAVELAELQSLEEDE